MRNRHRRNTSWQNVSKWYTEKVGEKGLYFHEHVIFPNLLRLMDINKDSKILDLGCGQGILYSKLKNIKYYKGIDLSKSLIQEAKSNNPKADFEVLDVSRHLNLEEKDFTHTTIILALQNIENMNGVIKNMHDHLVQNGHAYIILNHPHYRIPKSTSWEVDKETGYQYRKVFRYLSEHKIRIDMTPGNSKKKEYTYSFHRSLNDISNSLFNNGFVIEKIEEWVSDKQSEGKYAQQENFTRKEIPLFMCLVCRKV